MTGPGHAQNVLLYDPVRVDYTVTSAEMVMIETVAVNSWKDLTIAMAGVGIPCALNAFAIASSQDKFSATMPFFLNALFGAIGILLAIAFGVMWHRTGKSLSELLSAIKGKPRHLITFAASPVSGPAPQTGTTAQISPFHAPSIVTQTGDAANTTVPPQNP